MMSMTNPSQMTNPHAKPRILLIIDRPDWIFNRHANVLKQYLGGDFRFSICLKDDPIAEDDYDLIYPLEFNLIAAERIKNPARYVTGIRSHSTWAEINFSRLIARLQENFQQAHVVSQRLFDLFAPFLPGVKYVTHGVESQLFTPQTSARQFEKQLALGWAGNRNQPVKGFQRFIQPLDQIEGVSLKYRGFADENLSLAEMPGFYDSINAYICASLYEGNNNSLLEAALMERAIITTDCGTVGEYLVHGESALIVERKLESFQDAVKRLRDDPDLRARLGRNARQAVLRGGWDWQTKAQDYKAFFNSALEAAGNWAAPAKAPAMRLQDADPRDMARVLFGQWELQNEIFGGELGRMHSAWEQQSAYIQELETARDGLIEAVEDQKKYIQELDKQRIYIQELESARDMLAASLEEQKRYIDDLEQAKGQLLRDIEELKRPRSEP